MQVSTLVPSISAYNSIALQAQLLQAELIDLFGFQCALQSSGSLSRSIRSLKSIPKNSWVIHHYGCFDWAVFATMLSPNTVFVYHNVTPARFFWRWQPQVALKSVLAQLQLRMMPKSVRWVAVSKYNADCLRGIGFRNIDVCSPMVTKGQVTQRAGQAKDTLLFVGRISPNKGCDELLVQASKTAEILGRPIELRIVGDVKPGCPYGVSFSRLFEKLQGHPLLALRWDRGGIDDSVLAGLYATSTLYVSMSQHEGFGLPICEAIAHGCPALYTQCGGTESVLGGLGMVPAKNRHYFWKAIVDLLESRPAYDHLLVEQQSQIQEYTTPLLTERIRVVYGQLLEAN